MGKYGKHMVLPLSILMWLVVCQVWESPDEPHCVCRCPTPLHEYIPTTSWYYSTRCVRHRPALVYVVRINIRGFTCATSSTRLVLLLWNRSSQSA